MPGRGSGGSSYRFGFQGQEHDDEIANVTGGHLFFKYRVHDARLGRFFSVDPLAPEYPHNSPYAFSENRVIDGVELEGLEYRHYQASSTVNEDGNYTFENTIYYSMGTQTHWLVQTNNPFVPTWEFPILEKRIVIWVAYEYNGEVNEVGYKFKTWYEVKEAQNNNFQGIDITRIENTINAEVLAKKRINETCQAIGKIGEVATMLISPMVFRAKVPGPKPKSVYTRAKEIHSSLPKATQNRTTTSVGEVANSNGTTTRLVGSSEARLRPAQRAALKPGEVEVKGVGHAEQTVVNHAKSNGMKLTKVAASRPICTPCEKAIINAGAAPASPLKGKP